MADIKIWWQSWLEFDTLQFDRFLSPIGFWFLERKWLFTLADSFPCVNPYKEWDTLWLSCIHTTPACCNLTWQLWHWSITSSTQCSNNLSNNIDSLCPALRNEKLHNHEWPAITPIRAWHDLLWQIWPWSHTLGRETNSWRGECQVPKSTTQKCDREEEIAKREWTHLFALAILLNMKYQELRLLHARPFFIQSEAEESGVAHNHTNPSLARAWHNLPWQVWHPPHTSGCETKSKWQDVGRIKPLQSYRIIDSYLIWVISLACLQAIS